MQVRLIALYLLKLLKASAALRESDFRVSQPFFLKNSYQAIPVHLKKKQVRAVIFLQNEQET